MPDPPMTFVDPMSMASSVETLLTGPVVPSPGVSSSVCPKTTPPSALVIVREPMVSVDPMSSLKKTAPVPAVIVRLFDSPVCESIGESLVKVTSPASAGPVVISTELLSVTAPLTRTSSPVVSMLSVSPTPGPPLNTMPDPPMVVTLPMSNAEETPSPTKLITLTGPEPPVPGVSVSALPKVTPPVASSMTRRPISVLAAPLPMSSLKRT